MHEHLVDASVRPSRVGACVGDLVEEGAQLGVGALDVADRAGGEEAVAQKADRPLDLALLLGFAHGAEAGRDAEPASEVEQARVEAHGVASASASGVATWDYYPQTGLLFWDARTKKLLGVPPDTAGDYATFLAAVHLSVIPRSRAQSVKTAAA